MSSLEFPMIRGSLLENEACAKLPVLACLFADYLTVHFILLDEFGINPPKLTSKSL